MPVHLTSLFFDCRAEMSATLSRRFPHATAQDIEDALCDAYADLLAGFRGEEVRGGLLYLAAWRRLRGQFRRSARCQERAVPHLDELAGVERSAGQDAVVAAARWLEVFEAVVSVHGPPHAEALRRALLDRMETGDTDGVVAARHGLRRERLNRAWRAFIDALLPG